MTYIIYLESLENNLETIGNFLKFCTSFEISKQNCTYLKPQLSLYLKSSFVLIYLVLIFTKVEPFISYLSLTHIEIIIIYIHYYLIHI